MRRPFALLLLALGLLAAGCTPVRPVACGPSTCATGCCSAAGICEFGTLSAACGTGGAACGACKAAEVCRSQACVPVSACADGKVACGTGCVDTTADASNCGACGARCGPNEACSNGACGCAAGASRCKGSCIDTRSDNANCGSCNSTCEVDRQCQQGVCACKDGKALCGAQCLDTLTNPFHCGGCGLACALDLSCIDGRCLDACNGQCVPGQRCIEGTCVGCPTGQAFCPSGCADLQTDTANCGQCGNACTGGKVCRQGACGCAPGFDFCGGSCIDVTTDVANCGRCGNACAPRDTCLGGTCVPPCAPGLIRCSGLCVNPLNDIANCGGCGLACFGGTCSAGGCVSCNSATTDCDGDGWTLAQGDCCDDPACAPDPARVNPGAVEVVSNTFDDNCNGLLNAADLLDTAPCDAALASNDPDPLSAAKALGLCRFTTATPPLPQRTWGVLSAEWLRSDGSPLTAAQAHALRDRFGPSMLAQQGDRVLVLSSGIAADATQSNPGPNQGPGANQDNLHGSNGVSDVVDIDTCTDPRCLADWFRTANPPLKPAHALPSAPQCGLPSTFSQAFDSVMLHLRIRAPTNARSFSFKSRFLSVEYPEFVCSDFNDQFVALVDTPSGVPSPLPNPVDKNLLTYDSNGTPWPIGINVAAGTDLFSTCDTQATKPQCWEPVVSALSCAQGSGALTGTGFEAPFPTDCTRGGATGWLTTTGSVIPGQVLELRLSVWDVSDDFFDSTALIDGFTWSTQALKPGTD